jgi:hypothetical protein
MSLIPDSMNDLDNKTVLFVWGSGNSPDQLQLATDQLRSMNCSKVIVENSERLVMCKYYLNLINIIYFQRKSNYIFFSF